MRKARNPKIIPTNWYVITGGPCSGKTNVINHLAFLGYSIIPSPSRFLIDLERSKGFSTKNIRKSEANFQKRVLRIKVKLENRIPVTHLAFFERGMPDSIAYYKNCKLNPEPAIKASLRRRYKGVFLLDILPFEKDYARLENAKLAHSLHKLIQDSYKNLGYNVIRVPVESIDKRVKFILNKTTDF
jgi:predicted ATPase